mgnify:CR=1 FL=1
MYVRLLGGDVAAGVVLQAPEQVGGRVGVGQAFIDQRASSGVVLAKTITSLTLADGVLTATFDPAAAGMDQATFDTVNAFPNLAKFVGTPMMSKDDQGARLRTRITRVDTVSADGRSLGSATAAELYRAGTGEDLPAS